MKILQEFDPNTGVTTTLHQTESKVVIEKAYDAQPLLDACAAERAATAGERWGEFRKVGSISPAEYAKMLRQDGRIDPKRAIQWLKDNKKFVTFEKFLK